MDGAAERSANLSPDKGLEKGAGEKDSLKQNEDFGTPPHPARCIPLDPERDGYHWVRRYRGGPAIPLAWFANWHQNVGRGWGEWSEPDREDQWEYLGPCPSPDDAV